MELYEDVVNDAKKSKLPMIIGICIGVLIIIIIAIKLLMSRGRYRRSGKRRGYYVYRKR